MAELGQLEGAPMLLAERHAQVGLPMLRSALARQIGYRVGSAAQARYEIRLSRAERERLRDAVTRLGWSPGRLLDRLCDPAARSSWTDGRLVLRTASLQAAAMAVNDLMRDVNATLVARAEGARATLPDGERGRLCWEGVAGAIDVLVDACRPLAQPEHLG